MTLYFLLKWGEASFARIAFVPRTMPRTRGIQLEASSRQVATWREGQDPSYIPTERVDEKGLAPTGAAWLLASPRMGSDDLAKRARDAILTRAQWPVLLT